MVLLLLLGLALGRPLAAQPAAPRPQPVVPTSLDVVGLHLVLNEDARRLVQQKADGLSRHQPSFQARVDLADAAFPIIDRVLKEEGVPLDFRYLVLQESALLGDAVSIHGAVGYWQLKREAASDLGLVVNEDVDERRHLTTSTRAAARYLARNNATLRNWLNALLSYNTGLTGVKPYTLPTDPNATEMAITGATSPYVLMFLAQKIAFEPACGLNPKPPLRLQEFPAVPGQSLEAQARTLYADPAALALHNRWLLAAAVPTNRPYTLIVPIADAAQAAGLVANQRVESRRELLAEPVINLANTAEVRVNDLRALIALPGETTMDLARRANKRLGDFLRDNELTAFDTAVPGRPYFLESKRDEAAVEYHVLQPGETVFDVAQKYGVRRKAVMAKNRLALADELRPGRVLWLQHVRPREVAVEYRSLREGIRMERSANSVRAVSEPALATQPETTAREAAPEASKPRAAARKRAETAAQDGWGEALPGPNAPVMAAPAPPRPAAAPAPVVAQLPPPASAPAPAPLADEPSPAEVLPEPVASSASAASTAVASEPAPVPAAPVVAAVPEPVAAPKPAPVAVVPVIPAPVAAAPAATTHRVEPRETVYSISRRYQIPPAKLMAMNNLTPPATLAVGQVLVLQAEGALPSGALPARDIRPAGAANPALYVPKAANASAAATHSAMAAPAIQHTVAGGETLYSIARLYKVSVAELKAWNAKTEDAAKIGEVLRVSAGTQ